MAPLVGIALSVASKFLPELAGKIFGGKEAEEVAGKVINMAKVATGIADPEKALEAFKPSPQEVASLRKDILSVIELEVSDVQHARIHGKHEELTEKVAYSIMWGNLVLIGTLIGSFAWILSLDLDGHIAATLGTLIGAALNQLYQERQQVAGYLFGSSLGSKIKSMTGK